MVIKVFTMVKDEVDVIRSWIEYYGFLFGMENLYVVDNRSGDGTWEILQSYQARLGGLFQNPDYKAKGALMEHLFRTNAKANDWIFPIDIDEFVVFHETGSTTLSCDRERILAEIQRWSPVMSHHPRHILRMNYISPVPWSSQGHAHPGEFRGGDYQDYGVMAKVFFRYQDCPRSIDHGNHFPGYKKYFVSNLCLVHFHRRNSEQFQKKVRNNVQGLGYSWDLEFLRRLPLRGNGFHHVQTAICMLEGRYQFPYDPKYGDVGVSVGKIMDLSPLCSLLLSFGK